MSKQTPLQKAIEQLKANSIIEIRPDIYRDAINNTVKILTDLLLYEREVIEDAYGQGDIDGSAETMSGFGSRGYKTEHHYFTKTFTENGK